MTGSDGSDGHPRKFGTFPRKLRQYVYQEQAAHAAAGDPCVEPAHGADAPASRIAACSPKASSPTSSSSIRRPLPTRRRTSSPDAARRGDAVRAGERAGGGGCGQVHRRARGPSASACEQRVTSENVEQPTTRARRDSSHDERRAAHQGRQPRRRGVRARVRAVGGLRCARAARPARARGEMGRWFGRDSMERDFSARLAYERAVETYAFVDADTREVYEGFAAGANRYVELHPEEFPPASRRAFTGYDVLAHDVYMVGASQAARFLARNDPDVSHAQSRAASSCATPTSEGPPPEGPWVDMPDEGSNAWAFAPSRTKSGRAILLRNPHLSWNAGYYEAHVTVPGKLDFYGDFRIGGPFGVIGGFNRDLGWATTNNDPMLQQIYALTLDRANADHYMLDGTSHPIERTKVRVDVSRRREHGERDARGAFARRSGRSIYRDSTRIYVLRAGMDGDYRAGQQFLAMMRAQVARPNGRTRCACARGSTRASRTPIAPATSSMSGMRRSRRCRRAPARTPSPSRRTPSPTCGRTTCRSTRCRRCSTRRAATSRTRTIRRTSRTCGSCSIARSIPRTSRSRGSACAASSRST